MKNPSPTPSYLVCALSAALPLSGYAAEFMMPDNPTVNVSSDFSAVPSANLRTVTDSFGTTDALGLGDVNRPDGQTAAWDISTMTFAYDRIEKALWVGVEFGSDTGGPVDFASPGPGDKANLGDGEYFTGGIDLNNDNLFDLWFGVATHLTDAQFSAALYNPIFAFGGPTIAAYTGIDSEGKIPTSLGISSWTTQDLEDGGNAFEFKLNLGANPALSLLLPDATVDPTIFNFQFDTGSGSDDHGEDRAIGTIEFAPIPEPSSLALLAFGGLLAFRRKR
ncbi:PEP-CTERM sorting domain-containing protein [Verrucomicrobiaceae bacterium 227]